MNILLLGSGGREHAMVWKIRQSDAVKNLYVLPGNAGTTAIATNVNIPIDDFDAIGRFAVENEIDILLVGPEQPLVDGIKDYMASHDSYKNICVIGPSAKGAALEGSKDFAKSFMMKYGIPTAAYKTFTMVNRHEAAAFLSLCKAPYVLKADGLAAGKGVLILSSIDEALQEMDNMFAGKFGRAGSKVVIEEYLSGIELSVFVVTDGRSYKILPEAKDYKRVGENDSGPNTGGMGAVSPVPFADAVFMKKVEDRIVFPTLEGIQKEHIDYSGFIFIGLMNVAGEPHVIEYNVRMGDPESEVVFPRIQGDMVEMLMSIKNKTLDSYNVAVDPRTATTVMIVSGGYPGDYAKGKTIEHLETVQDSMVFHAGTVLQEGKVVTGGGRVLAITSLANNMQEALRKCYNNAARIRFDDMYYRKDIGFDLV